MAVILRIGTTEAKIENGKWTCENKTIEEILQADQAYFEEWELDAHEPDPDYGAAKWAAEQWNNAEVILPPDYEPPERPDDPNVSY